MIEIEYKGGKIEEDSFLLFAQDEGSVLQAFFPDDDKELKRWVEEINTTGAFTYKTPQLGFRAIVNQPVHVYWVVSGGRRFPTCSKWAKYNDQRPDTNEGY